MQVCHGWDGRYVGAIYYIGNGTEEHQGEVAMLLLRFAKKGWGALVSEQALGKALPDAKLFTMSGPGLGPMDNESRTLAITPLKQPISHLPRFLKATARRIARAVANDYIDYMAPAPKNGDSLQFAAS